MRKWGRQAGHVDATNHARKAHRAGDPDRAERWLRVAERRVALGQRWEDLYTDSRKREAEVAEADERHFAAIAKLKELNAPWMTDQLKWLADQVEKQVAQRLKEYGIVENDDADPEADRDEAAEEPGRDPLSGPFPWLRDDQKPRPG